jgi:replicative DNA helicase
MSVLSLADRLPPYNADAERALLGACLLDPSVVPDVAAILKPVDFFVTAHEMIAEMVWALAAEGITGDALSVADALEGAGQLDKVGGAEALGEMVQAVPHAVNAIYHARIVREKALTRAVAQACSEALADCYAGRLEASEVLSRAFARLQVADAGMRRGGPVPIGVPLLEAWQAIQRRRVGGEYPGVSTGLPELDDAIDGLMPGNLILLAARPSMGKTALALTIANHAAVDQHVPTLVLSLEMTARSIAARLLTMRSRVDGTLLRTGVELHPHDDRKVERGLTALAAADQLWVDDTPGLSPEDVLAIARRHQRDHGLGLLVIDYLGLLETPADVPKRANRNEVVTVISRRLKAIARELDVPVLVLSQLNRQSEARADKRPQMSDLRDSGALEQDADLVLLLHRPEHYDPASSPGLAELAIAKQRDGRTGTVRLTYVKNHLRFDPFVPYATHEQEAPY